MHFIGYFSLLAAVIYLILAVFVIKKNFRSQLHISVSLLTFIFFIWSSATSSYFVHSISLKRLWFFNHIACLGWISFPSIFLWFVLIFTEKKKILSSKFTYFAIFFLPALFIYKQVTSNAIICSFFKKDYGWAYTFSNTAWFWSYFSYLIIYSSAGLILLYLFFIKKQHFERKKQAKTILIASSVSLAIGILNGIVLPKLALLNVPGVSHTVCLIWVAGIIFVIAKYQFLDISPKIAAERIISTMTDALILTDAYNDIVTVNESALHLLKYDKEDLVGNSVNMFFEEDIIDGQKIDKLIHDGFVISHETNCKTKMDKLVPVLLSSSIIKNDNGTALGRVIVAHDISQQKRDQRKLQKEKMLSEAIINSLPGIFYLFNDNLKFLKWNKNFETISGYCDEEFYRLSPLDFFKESDKKIAEDAIKDVFEKGKSSIEVNLVTKNGEEIPYYFVGSMIMIDNVRCLIGTGIEVTSKK